MNKTDPTVGRTVDGDRPVLQCMKTGLLYYYADPPKRYVSVTDVFLGNPKKEVKDEQSASRRRCG